MAKQWCEREFDYFEGSDFADYGGVLVHTAGPWHLIDGDLIEMTADGTPELSAGMPVVRFAPVDAAQQQHERIDDYGSFAAAESTEEPE